LHITIEETDEGFLLCLHLLPNETSNELRGFASLRPGPNRLPRSLISTVPQTVLRPVEPRRPQDLDVGPVRASTGPSKETIVPILDAAIASGKAPVGGVIGGLSRGVGNLLFGTGIDPRAGVSISEQLAQLTDRSVAEVHTRLLAPFLGDPGLGTVATRAITGDIRGLAVRGDVERLEELQEFLEPVLERTETFIAAMSSPGSTIGDAAAGAPQMTGAARGIAVTRGERTRKSVSRLLSDVRTNLILARKVAGGP